MPIWRLGRYREALTVSSELYKKHIIGYLEKRGYFLKASSDVESTLADCILTRKGDNRDYWLEVKATTVSLGDSSFLSQLGKYLAQYLARTSKNRFKLIMACFRLINPAFSDKVFEEFESTAIEELVQKIAKASEPDIKSTIINANKNEIKQFFEDAVIIEADLKYLQIAEEKIRPTPPFHPDLPEAEYAAKVLQEFGDVTPSRSPDKIYLNLFRLEMPSKIYIGHTSYETAQAIINESAGKLFPLFHLENGKIFCFEDFTDNNFLSEFIIQGSATTTDLRDFAGSDTNEYIITVMLNRWIRRKCKAKGLEFDPRTRAYYFHRKNEARAVTIEWKPRSKHSTRELTKPMIREGKVNFWVHRAAEIFARKYWGEHYLQIKPRFLFSSDGMTLLEGEKADRLDRKFRKSMYSRNLNRLYDVLFWYRHIFPETAHLGTVSIDSYSGQAVQQLKVLEQSQIKIDWKPNVEIAEDVEKYDKIEPVSKRKSLVDFS
jgi:hypothetical protein